MKRDDEIQRLMRYAQGMGLSVRFKPYVRNGALAEWTTDGSEISVYVSSRTTNIDKILSLIHELGHHKSFINDGREIDPKLEEALESEEKRHRKRVFEGEKADTKYWEEIYKDTDCQFNIKILHRQKEFDIWCYEVYYETGEYPNGKERAVKMKELRKKYRG